MKPFDETYKPMSEEQREAGRRADDELLEKQHDALVEQLQREGRFQASDLVRDLIDNLRIARKRLEAVTTKPKKRQTVKTSAGRERASAKGTINKPDYGPDYKPDYKSSYKPLGIAPPHKHEYASDGKCIKVTQGITCTATRQRQRKSKETTIPGTDGAKTSEAGS